MAIAGTEAVNRSATRIDIDPPLAVLARLADAQIEAAAATRSALTGIATAARLIADTLLGGGRIVYAAAGSSALMALSDALELPGTFGIARDRIVVLLAGGADALTNLAGAPEDDRAQAVADIAAQGIGSGDCLVAVSASGSTPYAVAALAEAKRRGAKTIGMANNDGASLVRDADVGIVLATPPEMIAGSTRMGAGTAQKIALNMMSTMVGIHLGHVHDGYMVNLHADNAKLRDRAARIVAAIAGCGPDAASAFLRQSEGSVKVAVLMALGAASVDDARHRLQQSGQRLRPALAGLEEGSARSRQNGT